jgi:pseudoazurin
MQINKLIVAAAALLAFTSAPVVAADFTVHLLNKGADGLMVFEPALTKVAVGDTVTFVPTDKGHDVVTIPGMLPEGATAIAGKVNQEVKVTFTTPGFYGVKCVPHFAMGMIGAVQVGDAPAANLADAKAVKLGKKAHERFEPIFEAVEKAP